MCLKLKCWAEKHLQSFPPPHALRRILPGPIPGSSAGGCILFSLSRRPFWVRHLLNSRQNCLLPLHHCSQSLHLIIHAPNGLQARNPVIQNLVSR